MTHWTTGEMRGAYDRPELIPPMPQPLTSNDLAARMARTETHNYHAQLDRRRIERESLLRSQDNLQGIRALSSRVASLEKLEAARESLSKSRSDLLLHLKIALQWTAAILLIAAVLSGHVTLEHAKAFAPWLKLGG